MSATKSIQEIPSELLFVGMLSMLSCAVLLILIPHWQKIKTKSEVNNK